MTGFPTSREAGVLLPLFSLPGRGPIGSFADAPAFIDWLAGQGFGWWQTLPLHPGCAEFGDSPYSALSAFAIESAYVDPQHLRRGGLLTADEARRADATPSVRWDVARRRGRSLLRKAWERADATTRERAAAFARENAWVDAWAEYTALLEAHEGLDWPSWSGETKVDAAAVERACFEQWVLHTQWRDVRSYAESRGVRLLGDVPMYVLARSCDVWRAPTLFDVDERGRPRAHGGVPPDAFATEGQHWQMPVYRWDEHARSGFRWWVDRLARECELFDVVRLDHFRGFSAFWRIPADAGARDGAWAAGPGAELMGAIDGAIGRDRFIAEDLGDIDEPVVELLERFSLPGMRVASFAFTGAPEPHHDPARAPARSVAYTTTHDNLPLALAWSQLDAQARSTAAGLLGVDTNTTGARFARALVERVLDSPARLAVVPLCDVAGLGVEAVINRPGIPEGNWRWRARHADLDLASDAVRARLRSHGSLR